MTTFCQSFISKMRPDFAPNATLPRHRWYHFKEGYSAGLVQSYIEKYIPLNGSANIIDPFLGSGTTAVEGARLGYNVYGIETNPFMSFLSMVKTCDFTGIKNIEAIALKCLSNHDREKAFLLPNDTTLVERPCLSKWILNKSIAQRFEQLRTAISRIKTGNIRDLLLLALMSSIEEVSNARKDGKCWRYKRNWHNVKYEGINLDNAFAARVLNFAEDIESCPKLRGQATITTADSRSRTAYSNNNGLFDGLLTSPPYLNSFDYTDIYRPELLLLKKVKNSTELRQLRFSTIRSHVQVAWESSPPLDIPLLQQKIKKIKSAGSWCGRIPEMINAYFVDMDTVILQCTKQLKNNAVAGFVVADSAYCGVVIPVSIILTEILRRHGLKTKCIAVLRETLGNGNHQLRSSEKLMETLVVAKYCG
jgi:DNA modification methylase